MLGYTFNTHQSSLQLGLSLHILFAQSLKVSQRWKLRAFWVFFKHVHGLKLVHGFLGSQEYVGDFQSHNGHLTPQLFLFRFLVSLPFVPTVIHHLRQPWLKHLPVNVFHKRFRRGAFSTRWTLFRSNEDKLLNGVFQGTTRQSDNYSSLRTRLWKSSSSVLLPLVSRMWDVIFQGYCWAGDGTRS